MQTNNLGGVKLQDNQLCMGCMGDKGNNKICPICGWNEEQVPENPLYLLPRTIINEKYIVGKVLGHGGFGITYLGWDKVLNRKVAIKEYLPQQFSTRHPGEKDVTIFTNDYGRQYHDGLERFLDEAKILANFGDHQNIISVYDFFKLNNTAYIVMNYVEGITLKEYLDWNGGRISFDKALEIIAPVIKALEAVHEVNILHRDISPDNIYMCKSGQIKLLNFGASSQLVNDTKSLSVILKPGFAPEEQYRSKGVQGPWTDIYAVAATFYSMISGEEPPEALERLADDTIEWDNEIWGNVPESAVNCLKVALSVKAKDRYQNIKEFSQTLFPEGNIDKLIQDSLENIKAEVEVITKEISSKEQQNSQLDDSVMFCRECGTKIKKGTNFCSKCGAKVSSSQENTKKPGIPEIKASVIEENAEENESSKVGFDKGNKKRNIFIIAAALALLAIVAVVFGKRIGFFGNKAAKVNEFTAASSAESINKNGKPAKIKITQVNTDKFPLIKVYFSVVDEQNNQIPGLTAKYFKLGEKQQNVSYDKDLIISDLKSLNNSAAINLNLVMDVSGSMDGSKIQQAKTAANNFLDTVNYSAGDKIELIDFNDLVDINEPFSGNKSVLKSAIDRLYTEGQTAFYDSLNTALIETSKQSGHNCIIAFTDGEDNKSKYTKDDIITLSKQLSIPIYVIGIGSDVESDVLSDLATKSGGYYKSISDSNINDIQSIYKDIFSNQKSQYELTYTTKDSHISSDWRNISLRLDGDGYVAEDNTEYMPKEAVKTVNRKGNSNGNIVNLGLVTKQDDWIYYSNWMDNSQGICKIKEDGSGWTKISSDKARSLNVIGDWIYYENVSDSDDYIYNNKTVQTGKLYKIKTDGTGRQLVCDDNNQYFLPAVISVVDGWIYFPDRKDNERLYRIRINDNRVEKLNDNFSCNINVVGNYIYYGNMDDGDKLYRLDINTKESTKMVDVDSRSINATENGMYYVDITNKQTISRLEYNNSSVKLASYAYPINVNGNYIYYCSNSQLWKVNVNKGTPIKVLDVHTSFINIIDNWIYYINDGDGKLYKVDVNGSSNQLVQF